MSGARTCPDCQSKLQAFQMGPIELDRCPGCRGTFFDGGELEAVLGKPMAFEARSYVTSRKCAACGAGMKAATVAGLAVEQCGSCKGVFLDAGELRSLNGGEGVRVRADAKVNKVTFSCASCGKTLDASEALRTNEGYKCRECAPTASASGQDRQSMDDVTNWLSSLGV